MTRVLVIEPDAATRRKFTSWLESDGFEVQAAKDEDDGVGALKRDSASFHLVLTDIRPKGHAVIDQLLAVRSDVPVIAIAADNRSSVEAIERGASHCLLRPVEKEPLKRMVAHMTRSGLRHHTAMRSRPAQPRPSAGSVSATEAKNEFASILDTAVTRGPVFITKHDAPRAVLLALDEFNALTSAPNDRLTALTGVFDEMLDWMQKPGMRAQMQSAFDASPESLGEAAVRAARRG
jgi:antitoxin Phd